MAINQFSTSNTFGELVTSTSALITVANNLTDGPVFVANTQLQLRAPGTSLIVNNNVSILNVLTTNTLVITGNVTAANLKVTGPGAAFVVSNTGTFSNIIVANTSTLATANINILTGNCLSQFDTSGLALAMSLTFA
jgi:hypothetical protein